LLYVPAARAGTAPPAARLAADNVVLRWNAAALQGVRESRLGPPMVARALAIVQTCVYDARAACDRVAVGTRLGGALRLPPPRRSLANKREAISFAAYRALVDLFLGSRSNVFDPLTADLGYDPGDHSASGSDAAGVGNLAA
jgi:hypothetical protein